MQAYIAGISQTVYLHIPRYTGQNWGCYVAYVVSLTSKIVQPPITLNCHGLLPFRILSDVQERRLETEQVISDQPAVRQLSIRVVSLGALTRIVSHKATFLDTTVACI